MANKSPEEIVDLVDRELAAYHSCPFCNLYNTHQPACIYLLHKGNVDAKRAGKVSAKAEQKEPIKEAETEIKADEGDEDNQALLDAMKPKK
jgi:hypothetical protein